MNNKEKEEFFAVLKGEEVWTDAFASRGRGRMCIGIDYPFITYGGSRFKATRKEWNQIKKDFMEQEFGPNYKVKLRKELKEEFGKLKK